jgi:hypothetical protein
MGYTAGIFPFNACTWLVVLYYSSLPLPNSPRTRISTPLSNHGRAPNQPTKNTRPQALFT